MINQISATIIADSRNEFGNRLTTFLLTYPRIIHSEIMTHRMFSRNASSSRAVPFERLLESVNNNPFIPIAFQKTHKGMQGSEYITDEKEIELCKKGWLMAKDSAILHAKGLTEDLEITKQLVNRLLEPYQYYTCLVSATEFENFFAQRCPRYTSSDGKTYRSKRETPEYQWSKIFNEIEWLGMNKGQAEIHIMDLAEKMWDCMNESSPKLLKAGEWHIPYEDKIKELFDIDQSILDLDGIPASVKVGTIMAARTSYTTVGNELSDWSLAKYCQKVDELAKADPIHASPFEHCATAMDKEEYHWLYGGSGGNKNGNGWCGNFRGFIMYRKMLPNENITK